MKYNIIGDIHGRDVWKKLVIDDAINIFVGDYFSPYHSMSFEKQKRNFLDIVDYKKNHWDNVVLLIGNHDEDHWHICEGYSRHDRENENFIHDLFEMHKGLFQVAYSIENKVLVTHAGVSIIWYDHYKNHTLSWIVADCNYDDPDFVESPYTHEKVPFENPIRYSLMSSAEEAYKAYTDKYYRDGINSVGDPKEGNIIKWNNNYWRWNGEKFVKYVVTPDEAATFINDLWLSGKYNAFNFNSNCGPMDYCGDDERHGPMWIRASALRSCNVFAYSPYIQVFGHTISHSIEHYSDYKNVYKGQMYMVDCLEKVKESLLIEYDDNKIQRISHYKVD